MKILSRLCLLSIVVVGITATKKTVAHYQTKNKECDYPIEVPAFKVIHVELRNIQKGNKITFHRNVIKSSLKILSLESEQGDIDVITSTNTVCVQLGSQKLSSKPKVTIKYSEMEPPTVSGGSRCGGNHSGVFRAFQSPTVETNTRTFLLCDIIYKRNYENYTIASGRPANNPSGLYFDVFYNDQQFEEYPVLNENKYNVYVFTGTSLRVRHKVLIDKGIVNENTGAISQYERLETPNGFCGEMMQNPTGVIHPPLFNPGFKGYVFCDNTIRIQKPSNLTIVISQFKNPFEDNVDISMRSLDGTLKVPKLHVADGYSFSKIVSSDVAIRFHYTVTDGKSAQFQATYTVRNAKNTTSKKP